MSSPAPLETHPADRPAKRVKKIGRGRKLEKCVEPKPDGRYLIYYTPS